MFRFILLLCLLVGMNAYSSAQSLFHATSTVSISAPSTTPKANFKVNSHDFGEVLQGTSLSHTFTFKNTGSTPLVLEKVKPSCGCTAVDYTKEALKPGEEGFVTVGYDATKVGFFSKKVSLKFKGDEDFVYLTFNGVTVEK